MQLILRNLMEDVVLKKLEELDNCLDYCHCDLCRLDIASYALNRLPPKYIATTQGELLAKLDSLDPQSDTTIIATIIKATEVVKQHPRHKN